MKNEKLTSKVAGITGAEPLKLRFIGLCFSVL
jgi:hypothetical protein